MKKAVWEALFSIEKNILFSSVKKGFMVTFPIVLIGTAAVLINSILLPFLESVMYVWHADLISGFCVTLHTATVGSLSLYLAIAVGYYYVWACNVQNVLLRLMAVFSGVICFFILIGGTAGPNFASYMGVIGVLPALFVELTFVSLFLTVTRWIIKRNSESDLGIDDNLRVSMVSILPILVTLLSCVLLRHVAVSVFHMADVYTILSEFFHSLFKWKSFGLFSGLLFTVLVHFLWLLGIHGGNVMDPISEELLVPLIADPNSIMSKSFLDTFSLIGGSGTTLCLVIAFLIVSRSKVTRGIARTAVPMVLFNINELIVFGIPIMFNPILAIPFMLVPIQSILIAYIATLLGFIPVITEAINWATPVFYSGYLATGSINGVIVQVVILVCGVWVYVPFVKLLDRFQVEKELRILDELIAWFRTNETAGVSEPMLQRTDALGQMARTLGHQLRLDIEHDAVPLHYQPQMDVNDTIVGGEALLRWQYQGQLVYPPLVIALAREEGLLNQFTLQSAQAVCDTIVATEKAIGHPVHIALNLTARQLNDIELVEGIIAIAKESNTVHMLHLELTEETSLNGFNNIGDNIRLLCEQGIEVAIDDFGMGQTSINYLKENTFTYVKIDGSLVTQILTNERCVQIIASIIELGRSLQYQVIAEYVSSVEIKERLMEMGCYLFQGYYYSPAIPKEEFIQYCKKTMPMDTSA